MKVKIIRMFAYFIICSVISILVSCDIEDYPYMIARDKQTVRFFRLVTPNANAPGFNAEAMTRLESRFQAEGFITSYLGVKTIAEMKDQMSQVSFIIIHDDKNAVITVTAEEQAILREYLKKGGFIWVDNCQPADPYYDTYIFTIFPGMFDANAIEYLTSDSPVNNLRYGFTGAPATQWDASTQIGVARVDGSIVLLSTPQDYFCQMDPGWSTDAAVMENAFRYAVNVALYANLR